MDIMFYRKTSTFVAERRCIKRMLKQKWYFSVMEAAENLRVNGFDIKSQKSKTHVVSSLMGVCSAKMWMCWCQCLSFCPVLWCFMWITASLSCTFSTVATYFAGFLLFPLCCSCLRDVFTAAYLKWRPLRRLPGCLCCCVLVMWASTNMLRDDVSYHFVKFHVRHWML